MSNQKIIHDAMNKLQELMGIAAFTSCKKDGVKIEITVREIAKLLEQIQEAG